MKKTLFLILVLTLLLSGCRADPEPTVPRETTPSAATKPSASTNGTTEETVTLSDYQAPMVSFASPVITEAYGGTESAPLLVYRYQIMELLLEDPQVSEWVTLELLNHTEFGTTAGPGLMAAAAESGASVEFSLIHTPTRLDRGLLSLVSTQVISGTGPKATGAMASASFDLISGRLLALRDILVPQYDAQALAQVIISVLDPLAKAGQLYSDYAYVVSELFTSNTPVKNWYFSDEGLCLYFAPYEVAPYNMGYVTAEIPYGLLTGLLREEYFPGEELGLVGNLRCTKGLDAVENFSQFRDLILDRNGSEWVLTAEGALENLRIETGSIQDGQFFPEATVFAAATLCQADAVVLQALPETLETLWVTYRSGGEHHAFLLSDFIA